MLLLFALVISGASAQDSDSVVKRNQQMAKVYADTAFAFFMQGNIEAALETADEAMSYWPATSDALVIKYFVLKARNAPLETCISVLDAALKADTFNNFYKEDVLVRFCHELITAQRIYEALTAAQNVIAEDEGNFILARAQLELGNLDTSLVYYKAYLAMHPDAIESLIPWLMRAGKSAYTSQAGTYIEYIKNTLLQFIRFEHPEILPALVPFAEDRETARLYLREYRAYNKVNAYASYFSYEYGLIGWETLLDELFVHAGSVPYEVYEHVALAVPTPEALLKLKQKLETWSGFIVNDSNYDKVPEVLLEFSNGLPVHAFRDSDQNGVYEAEVLFADGSPEVVRFTLQNTVYDINYYKWPLVREVLVSDVGSSLVFTFVPGAYSWPFVQKLFLSKLDATLALWYRFPDRLYADTLHALAKAAIKVERVQQASMLQGKTANANGSTFISGNLGATAGQSSGMNTHTSALADQTTQTVTLGSSVPVFSMSTDGGYKTFTLYSSGFPIYERIDLDADGTYDGVRMYIHNSKGVPVLAETRIDMDGNAIYEYIERYFPTLTKIWDTNQDGSADIVITEETTGTIRYEAALDTSGTFPLVVYLKDNIPVLVVFRGQEQPLIRDLNSTVYWIGQKYFDFEKTQPVEGWGIMNGKRYYVLKTETLYFVQPFGP